MPEKKPKVSDYFAELYVAGRLADAGWNIYFPHRDEGFDFIISKQVCNRILIRPVQVKGKYPTGEKTDRVVYGYRGKLSQLHSEMVLAIPYFSTSRPNDPPVMVAYMPRALIKGDSRRFRCEPASYKGSQPQTRRDYKRFFDGIGIKLLEEETWASTSVSVQE